MKQPIIGRATGGDGGMVLGIGWYPDAAEFARAREMFPDGDGLHDTYEEWVRSAEEAERSMRAQGMVLERIPLRVDAVLRWCARQGRPADGSARSEYVVREVELRAKIRRPGTG